MEEDGLTRVGRLVSFTLALGGDGRANLGEGGREVVPGVDEGGAGVADGDTNKLYASLMSSEGSEYGEVLVGLLVVFLVAAKIPAETDLEEDEGTVLQVEGVDVGGCVGWHSSCVDYVGGSSRSCRL
jgi:hypothetical protein